MENILLFSDAHIHTHKNSLKRLKHCLDSLRWVFDTAIQRNIKDIVFLGDLFQDREEIQVLPYQKTFEVINEFAGGNNPKVNLYLLIGNHDMWYADKTDVSSIYPFGAIKNVKIINKCETINIAGLDIDFLPFTLNPLKSLENFQESQSKVLCGHLALDGAKLNAFYNTQADISVEYEGDMVAVGCEKFHKWEKVFLGHYHCEQKIENIEYVGSPLQLNFAEAFQKKHIIILNTETLQQEYVENTFSPKHLIIDEDEINKYELNNTFVKLKPKDMSSCDLVDIKSNLLKENDILSFEFASTSKNNEDNSLIQHIDDVKNILSYNQDEMIDAYIKAAGTDGLDEQLLRQVGKKFCQKNQIN